MKGVDVSKVRNLAVLGHSGCGKTSLVDALMFVSGAVNRLGSPDNGTSISDTREEERDRKCSISATPIRLESGGHSVFLIDCPGYADFFGEVVSALAVADCALLVVDASGGIEVGTRNNWNCAVANGAPRAVFISKLDRENTDYARTLADLNEAFPGTNFFPVNLPVGREGSLSGAKATLGGDFDGVDASLAGRAEAFKTKLIEGVAETDDALLERYLEEGTLPEAEVEKGMRSAVAAGLLVPVFCGAPTKEIGVKELIEGVIALFPSPKDGSPLRVGEAEIEADPAKPLVARVFKNVTDPFVGQLTYIRVYRGTLKAQAGVYNRNRSQAERYGHVYLIKGKEQINVEEAGPGDIVAIPKLKVTQVGDTLCDSSVEIAFPPIRFPRPVASFAVYAKARGDEEKISTGLRRLTEEDPTLEVERNTMTQEMVLSGLGDVQIQVAVDRLKSKFHVDVDLKEPRVAYKETITARGETKYRHKKQTGGAGQFAEVWMYMEPYREGAENAETKAKKDLIDLDWDGRLLFLDEVVGGHIPTQLVGSCKKGILKAMAKGPLAGYPVVDVAVSVYDGKTHPVDSKDIAFQIAARQGFKECFVQAGPVLLEPIMDVDIVVTKESMGAITGDLNTRRGRILGMEAEGNLQRVKAQVPLAEMLRYSAELRSLTGGRGSFSMEKSHYEQVPANIAQKVIAGAKKEKEEE